MPKDTKISLHDNGSGRRWNETSAKALMLSWDPNLLSTDPNAIVDINFVGFIENEKTYKVILKSPEWIYEFASTLYMYINLYI